jgi:hypothetical protein
MNRHPIVIRSINMNNSKTPKIVVGVGLAAIYATGLAVFTLRGMHNDVVVSTSAAPPALAAEPAPPAIEPAPAATPASVTEQTAGAPTAAAPAPSTAGNATASPLPRAESQANLAGKEQPVPRVATAPAEESAAEESAPANDVASADNEAADSAGDAPSSVQAGSAPTGNDSQITADVKSQMAAVVLDGTIDVTTKDGVVELAGSVPSQEVVDKARVVASNVTDVRDVDVSALMISN